MKEGEEEEGTEIQQKKASLLFAGSGKCSQEAAPGGEPKPKPPRMDIRRAPPLRQRHLLQLRPKHQMR